MFIIGYEYNGSKTLMHFKSHDDFHTYLSSTKFKIHEYDSFKIEGMNLEITRHIDLENQEPVKCALIEFEDGDDVLIVYQNPEDLTADIIALQPIFDLDKFNQIYSIKLFQES